MRLVSLTMRPRGTGCSEVHIQKRIDKEAFKSIKYHSIKSHYIIYKLIPRMNVRFVNIRIRP